MSNTEGNTDAQSPILKRIGGTMTFEEREKLEREKKVGELQQLLGEAQKLKDKRLAIARKLEEEWKKHVSPAGALKLPPLLEKRRLEYQIPDAAFSRACMFDKLLLFQIPMWEQETYGDTSIIMPETGTQRMEESAPRGIIVSAGLQALDVLHSHGSGLGHKVLYVHMSPWRVPFMMISGHELYLIPLRVGDLVADEDTGSALLSGELGVARVEGGHRYMNGEGQAPSPLPVKNRGEF